MQNEPSREEAIADYKAVVTGKAKPRRIEKVFEDKTPKVIAGVVGMPEYELWPLTNRAGRRRFEQACMSIAKRQIKRQIRQLAREQMKPIPVEVEEVPNGEEMPARDAA